MTQLVTTLFGLLCGFELNTEEVIYACPILLQGRSSIPRDVSASFPALSISNYATVAVS